MLLAGGSFFHFAPRAGAFLANPPFDPPLVAALAARITSLLATADAASPPAALAFVVVVPCWPEQPCWLALRPSAHHTLRLPRSKHAYIDGGQHLGRRATPLRLSNHDSSVFFCRSAAAQRAAPLTHSREQRLREAFTGGLKVQGALHK